MASTAGAVTAAGGRVAAAAADGMALARRFRAVRAETLRRIAGLSAEDLLAQSMPDASPGKWHLAHTSWFFEVMVLAPSAGQSPSHPEWLPLFNSYYEALGERQPRPQRGLLTRPDLAQVLEYRAGIERRMEEFLGGAPPAAALAATELGLQHEQQHQELLVTDLKHLFFHNPLRPGWRMPVQPVGAALAPMQWIERAQGGTCEIGAEGTGDFAFDSERPRHRAWLEPFALADRPVSCGEYLAFMEAGGYREPRWWLSDGWAAVQAGGWQAPLYWERGVDGSWQRFATCGMRALDPAEPVAHLSFYEADAFARFSAARLPTEAEWECVAREQQWQAPDTGALEPAPMQGRCFGGQVWEWTASAYSPYPGFRPLPGAAGEYNGKFMSGQMVLRGGSCATPAGHARATYRNFFPPAARWQFSGLRLARDLR